MQESIGSRDREPGGAWKGRKRTACRTPANETVAPSPSQTSPSQTQSQKNNNKRAKIVKQPSTVPSIHASTSSKEANHPVPSSTDPPLLRRDAPHMVGEDASAQYQIGKPPTRKKKHGGSLTHLPLCNNQSLEKTLSEEDLEQRRIDSANYITDQILELGDPGVTVGCHQGRIRDWRVSSILVSLNTMICVYAHKKHF